MEYCLSDAKAKGKSGVCILGPQKQKAWLSNQSFVKKYGFVVVDRTDNEYELLALSFDGTTPQIDTLRKAKELPCVFTNRAVFYKGRLKKLLFHSVDNTL